MKRLVLFVEGDGDVGAAPVLVRRLRNETGKSYGIFVDDHPFRVGSVEKLMKDDFLKWKRFLGACVKRPNVGGVLLLLDGDIQKVGGMPFCAAEVAKALASHAIHAGAAIISPS
jgi:hypothetical protein